MIVSHPGSNPGRVLLPFTPNDMLCDSVFFSVTVHTSGWKSLLSFLFLLISRPFLLPRAPFYFFGFLLFLCVHCHDSDFSISCFLA